MKALLLHPGTQYSHKLAVQLQRVDCLSRFVTGIAFSEDSNLLKFLPGALRKKVANRIIDKVIPKNKIETIPFPEIMSLRRLKNGDDMEATLLKRNKEFQLKVNKKYFSDSDAVIGFDTSSWIAAAKAKAMGKPFVLDQSIAHPREKELIFNNLRIMYPEWSGDIAPKEDSSIAIEELEYSLATRIVVASSFTKQSLIKHGIDESKIILNPYGVSSHFFRKKKKNVSEKLRFLYLGLLGVRKGLPLLLDVWKEKEFSSVAELWIAGPSSQFFLNATENIPGVFYKGKVSFDEIPGLLNECDCLVFPSFFEGFGQVILEAMAAGLPVITTDATAGPDIIENGTDGFVITTGDKIELSQIMLELTNDRNKAFEMGKRAVEKARSFTWDAYGDRWKKILHEITS